MIITDGMKVQEGLLNPDQTVKAALGLIRLANENPKAISVQRIAQTGGEWIRIRPSKAAPKDSLRGEGQVRVVCAVQDENVIVKYVCAKSDDTYDVAEMLWKAEKRGK